MMDEGLIASIVAEVMKSLNNTLKKPQLLAVNASEEKLKALEKKWHVIKPPSLPNGLSECKEALFFEVGQDLLAKTAIGIADTEESKLFSTCMRNEINTTFLLSEELLTFFQWHQATNHPYSKFLLDYKQQLETFRVQFCSFSEFMADQSNKKNTREPRTYSKLLTEKDVRENSNREIIINRATIVTPLACDAARELGKKIKFIE